MFVGVRERLPHGVCQKGRLAGLSLRLSGGNRPGPEPSSEPSLPAVSPPRFGDIRARRANPRSLTPSSQLEVRGSPPPRAGALYAKTLFPLHRSRTFSSSRAAPAVWAPSPG